MMAASLARTRVVSGTKLLEMKESVDSDALRSLQQQVAVGGRWYLGFVLVQRRRCGPAFPSVSTCSLAI